MTKIKQSLKQRLWGEKPELVREIDLRTPELIRKLREHEIDETYGKKENGSGDQGRVV